MQDLTNDPNAGGKAYLSPSSMSGGNTIYDAPALAMTAPGSPSVNSYANVTPDHLPLPDVSGPKINLNEQSQPPHVQEESSPAGFNTGWTPGHGSHAEDGGRWVLTPGHDKNRLPADQGWRA